MAGDIGFWRTLFECLRTEFLILDSPQRLSVRKRVATVTQ